MCTISCYTDGRGRSGQIDAERVRAQNLSLRWTGGAGRSPPRRLQIAAVEVAAELVGLDHGGQAIERAIGVDLACLGVHRRTT